MRSWVQLRGLALVALGVLAMVAAGCGDSGGGAKGGAEAGASAATKKDHYTFVVSNNFLGNDYRPELLRVAELTAKLPPFKDRVTLKIVQSQPTAAAQLADLNNIIREKPDAIMLVPPDPTSVNPAIKRACAAGIVVVNVDQSATEPCTWTVALDFYKASHVVGEWMADQLGGKGSVFVDSGLAGPDIAKANEEGFIDGLKSAGPDITIAGKYAGEFSNAPSQQAVSSLLVGHRDVAGIHNQGYCSPVSNALENANLKPLPVTCFAYNGEIQHCASGGRQCALITGAPTGIQIAMKTALDVLDGKANPPKDKVIPNPTAIYVTNADSFKPKDDFGFKIAPLEVTQCGDDVPPLGTGCSDLPPGMAMPFTLPEYPISGLAAAGKAG
jgi:ribose transport system substrate-binding protein